MRLKFVAYGKGSIYSTLVTLLYKSQNMPQNSIKNIIFDVSDVLTTYAHGPQYSNELLSEETGVSMDVIKDFFKEYIETGRKVQGLSFEEFWPTRTVDTKQLTLEDVKKSGKRHGDNIAINQQMTALLQTLRPTYRLFALTNAWKPGHPFKSKLESYFEAFVQSCDIHLWKPNRDVFEYMIETYNLTPQETLFIDNDLKNIEMAQQVGMHAIQFFTFEKLTEELRNFLTPGVRI
ncbi:MAG: hypothetical protein A3E36_00710 [Candidatus Andersenbacteria bacterium RIFCSPHIGHO2_12_FULL_45_11b]|uniref:Haloacid dehalogenase n=1 Tax=Candidatus Andersenbacteria bacterium RIFCSPHIGHO2_12_FULL_45_11b TaxID=1797282 RepID=A0A1G1X582_9BACT|nr:MAG: hypothetical protein A3E36_00710 [Candidatus Andersenbacteria bacterium RIFCSPHIGHO2_12_FULL_45_11b]